MEQRRTNLGTEFNPENIGFVKVRVKTKDEAIALLKEFWCAMGLVSSNFTPEDYLAQITQGDRTSVQEVGNEWVVNFNGNWSPITNKAYQWLKKKDLLKDTHKAGNLS